MMLAPETGRRGGALMQPLLFSAVGREGVGGEQKICVLWQIRLSPLEMYFSIFQSSSGLVLGMVSKSTVTSAPG